MAIMIIALLSNCNVLLWSNPFEESSAEVAHAIGSRFLPCLVLPGSGSRVGVEYLTGEGNINDTRGKIIYIKQEMAMMDRG